MALVLGAPGAAMAERVTVAALGDSLTAGYGLPRADGFVPRMEAWLRARGHDVALVNAGVSGDTTAGGAARIGWTLTPEVDAVSVALGGNDFLRGIDPATSRANLDRILGATQEAGLPTLMIGLVASPNYGAEWKAAFDAMFPEVAQARGAAYAPSFFAGMTRAAGGGAPSQVRAYMQADGIHPNAEGIELIVEHLGPYYEALIAAAEAQAG